MISMMADKLVYRVSRGSATSGIVWKKLKHFIDVRRRHSTGVSHLNPIIVGGCPRSGTTLARALIGMHPEIASPQRECHILLGIRKWESLKNAFELSDKEIVGLYRRYPGRVDFMEAVFRLYMERYEKPFICIKAPAHIYFVHELFRYFPHMRFIHVIRDGRDTACSLRTHPKRKLVKGEFVPVSTRNPFDYCIRRWVAAIHQGLSGRSYENYMEIKYEDLVQSTVETMRRVYGFMGVDVISERELLGFHRSEIPEKHPSNVEIGKALYKGAVRRWTRDMTCGEKALFKRMAGGLLIELGYEKDFEW